MIKRLIFLILVSLATLVVSGTYFEDPRVVTMNTDTTGDTARVIKFEPKVALDSYVYSCTLSIPTLAADSMDDISWTSPLQSMRLDFGVITATPTLIDTTVATGLGLVGCTAVFASANEVGMEYSTSTAANATLATAIDGFVTAWQAATALSDSITAEDSVTYVKLVSRYSELTFDGRWSMQLGSSAGAPTDSLDTVSSVVPTIASVIDSLVVTANAADSGANYVTASDSTTFYIIQSDDQGLNFFVQAASGFHADTLDTTHTQLNVTSYSGKTDTIDIVGLIQRDGNLYPEYSRFILKPCTTTAAGLGLSDSGYLWLYTVFDDEYFLIAADTCTDLPCTLRVAYDGPVADSLFKAYLALGWRVADSSSDTVLPFLEYPIEVNYILGTK